VIWLPLTGTPLEQAAHDYAANGLAVFPCRGKVPLTDNGYKDASADLEQVRAWWTANPHANIGLPMWGARRLVALDVDAGKGGIEARAELERKHGPLPFTLRAATGGGGEHWIFTAPEGVKVGNRAGVVPGVDVRGEGGYIIAAPSIHPDTRKHYRWHCRVEPLPMPAWLVELVAVKPVERKPYNPPPPGPARTQRERYARAVLKKLAEEVATAGEGTRNDTLNRAWWRAAHFRDVLTRSEAYEALRAAALACGLPEREIEQVMR
jgi:hypothetical protein